MMKEFIHNQTVSWENVYPTMNYRMDRYGHNLYLNSSAGLLKYTTKKDHHLNRFRDDVVNKFNALFEARAGQKDFIKLYKYAMKNYKCSYTGNLNTRLKFLYVF